MITVLAGGVGAARFLRGLLTAVDPSTVAAVVNTAEGFFAIRDVCSHGEVPLSEGEVDGPTLECYMHGSRFDLRTGEPLELPATQPVPIYPVRLDGTDIYVDIDNPINQEN